MRDESAVRISILIIYVVPTIRCIAAGALTGSVRVHAATSRCSRIGGALCCSASCACRSTSATGTSSRSAAGATGATTSRSAATTAAALCQRGRTDGDCCKQRKSEYCSYRHAGLHVGVSFMKKPPTHGLFRFGQTAARSDDPDPGARAGKPTPSMQKAPGEVEPSGAAICATNSAARRCGGGPAAVPATPFRQARLMTRAPSLGRGFCLGLGACVTNRPAAPLIWCVRIGGARRDPLGHPRKLPRPRPENSFSFRRRST